MFCSIEPLDFALFRDGRPFAPDQFSRAVSVGTIPPPRTLHSALRDLILRHQGVQYADFHNKAVPEAVGKVVGCGNELGTLNVKGPWMASSTSRGNQLLLPAPADCILVKGYGGVLVPEKPGTRASNLPGTLLPLRPWKDDIGSPGKWMECSDTDEVQSAPDDGDRFLYDALSLENYLKQAPGALAPLGENGPRPEVHVGIERNRATFKAKEGRLYAAEFLRFPFGDPNGATTFYTAEISGDRGLLPEDTVFAFGGERRPFRFRLMTQTFIVDNLRTKIEALVEVQNGRIRFRLYLITPARYRAGWIPDFITDPATLTGADAKFNYTLLAASVPRGVHYSGWDIKKSSPRPAQRLVPAGSVYFCEAQPKNGATVADLFDTFWYQSVTATPDDRHMGFGVTLIGAWKHGN